MMAGRAMGRVAIFVAGLQLLFGGVHLQNVMCPSQCDCMENADDTGLDIQCVFISAIPKFPSSATRIYVSTYGQPDIEPGSFANMNNVESILIMGNIGFVKNGSFENISGRKESGNQTSAIDFFAVDIQRIESGAFSGISGFSTFSVASFKIQELQTQAFQNFRNIKNVLFWSGEFQQIAEESVYGFNSIGEIGFWSVTVSFLKPRIFHTTANIGKISFLNSTLQIIERDALGYSQCLGELSIVSCHVGDFRNFALFGLDNVYLIRITNTSIAQRGERMLEGIQRVAKYDLQPDLVYHTPEQVDMPSRDCPLAQADPCQHITCYRDTRCVTDTYRRPTCESCPNSSDCQVNRLTAAPSSPDDVSSSPKTTISHAEDDGESVIYGYRSLIIVAVALTLVLLSVLACVVIYMRGLLNGYLCISEDKSQGFDLQHGKKAVRRQRRATPDGEPGTASGIETGPVAGPDSERALYNPAYTGEKV